MSPPYERLVWKEYRAIKSFWFGLLIVHVGICLISIAAVESDPDNLINLFVTGSAGVLAMGFLAGTLVMAFAGEDENHTAMLLRMLPARTMTVLAAKLTTTLLGTIALLSVCNALNLLVISWAGQPWDPLGTGREVVPLSEWMMLLLGAVTLVTGCLLCSMSTQRVMVAFAWIVIWFLLLQFLVSWGLLNKQPVPVFVVLLVALALIRPVLRRWHLGQFSFRWRRRQGLQKSVQLTERLSEMWSNVWRRPLHFAATRAGMSNRIVAVLCWQELRRATMFALTFLGAGLLLLLLLLQVCFRDFFFPTVLIVAAACLEAGLRSFRHDQQKLHGLFWSHRGVSPGRVWLIRNFVWLPAMLLVVFGLMMSEVVVAWAFGFSAHAGPNGEPLVVVLMDRLLAVFSLPSQQRQMWTLFNVFWLLSPLVGIYFMAQLCSCWIRSSLLAAFATIFAVIPVVALWVYLAQFRMPGLLLYLPFVLLMLLAMLLTRRQWMDRQGGTWLQVWRWTSVVAAAACLWPLSQYWWAIEIPTVAAAYPNTVSEQGAADYSAENATGPWAQAWQRLEDASYSRHFPFSYDVANIWWSSDDYRTVGNDAHLSLILGQQPELQQRAASVEQRKSQLEAIDDVYSMWIDDPDLNLPPQWRLPWTGHERLSAEVTRGLVLAAYDLVDESDFKGAIDRLLQAVDLNRRFKTESTQWLHWKNAVLQESLALRTLRDVAANDGVTERLLRDARMQLVQLHRQPGYRSLSVVPVNRLAAYRNVLTRSQAFADPELERKLLPKEDAWPVRHIRDSWAERERFLRHCDHLARFGEPHVQKSASEVVRRRSEFEQWLQQDAYAGSLLSADLPGLPIPLDLRWQYQLQARIVNEEQGTAVVLALQEYKRRHDRFPDGLGDLEEVGLPRSDFGLMRDITNNVEMGYAVGGYGQTLPMLTPSGKLKVISGDQPVLWTSGALGPNSIHFEERASAVAYHNPNVVEFLNGTGTFVGGPDILLDHVRAFRKLSAESEPDFDVPWLELPGSFEAADEPAVLLQTTPQSAEADEPDSEPAPDN